MEMVQCAPSAGQKWFLPGNGPRVEGRFCGRPSALRSCGGELSFRQPASLEWHTVRFRTPPRASGAHRRASSLGRQWTATSADPADDSRSLLASDEEQQLLLLTGDSIDLKGASIFLVGMMGSGKTTVGRILAQGLGYCFFDSDALVEQAAGVTVADMFRAGQETEFRNAESETLLQLSSRGRLVVATGGGAVVRPQNWAYMRHGITVFLDVPVEDLARRIVEVGCHSRPLLKLGGYVQALECLSSLFEEREGYYRLADAVVSVAGLAASMSIGVKNVTPTMIAVQVVKELQALVRAKKAMTHLAC